MNATKKMENMMSILLTLGTLISAALVIFGGTLYLIKYGSDPVHFEWMTNNNYQLNLKRILFMSTSVYSLTIVEVGLLLLVGTQILRVGLLVWFYAKMRDYWFTAISLFILLTLIYSFFLRN